MAIVPWDACGLAKFDHRKKGVDYVSPGSGKPSSTLATRAGSGVMSLSGDCHHFVAGFEDVAPDEKPDEKVPVSSCRLSFWGMVKSGPDLVTIR